MKLYLIRHAEADGNLYRVAQGQDDSSVTDRGLRQIGALERRFAGVPVDAAYSSDLYRTCRTAAAICAPRDLPLHRRRALREICVGAWERRPWGEIYREDPVQMMNFLQDLGHWHVPGGEAPEAVEASSDKVSTVLVNQMASSLTETLRQAMSIAGRTEGAELSIGYADTGVYPLSAVWLTD